MVLLDKWSDLQVISHSLHYIKILYLFTYKTRFSLSIMTTNKLITPMKFYMSFTLPKQSHFIR